MSSNISRGHYEFSNISRGHYEFSDISRGIMSLVI